jgi:hypothetical protein
MVLGVHALVGGGGTKGHTNVTVIPMVRPKNVDFYLLNDVKYDL